MQSLRGRGQKGRRRGAREGGVVGKEGGGRVRGAGQKRAGGGQRRVGQERSHSPGHDTGSFSQAPLQDLVPANELLALRRQEAVDATDEPALQLVLVLQLLLLDALLARWAAAPPRLGALQSC